MDIHHQREILYEITMSIGFSLDLPIMFKHCLPLFLRRLDGLMVSVVEMRAGQIHPLYTIPRSTNLPKLTAFLQAVPHDGEMVLTREGKAFHRWRLPEIGWLVLERNLPLSRALCRDIDTLAAKLALAIRACRQFAELNAAKQTLAETEERWKFALEGTEVGVWDWNPQTDEAKFSRQWKAMLGYSEAEFPDRGAAWFACLHPDDRERVQDTVQAYFQGQRERYEAEFRCRCQDGSWKWIQARGALVQRDAAQQPWRMVGTHTDITERKLSEEKIQQLAMYDPLTQLPNRRLLHDRLLLAMHTSNRNQPFAALLIVDLDNFKLINDSKGHTVGDLVLVEVARRLSQVVREDDTVARVGGDEFVVILTDLNPQLSHAISEVEHLVGRMLHQLERPFVLPNYVHHGSASIGISLFKGHEFDAEILFQRADTAMYRAKTSGKNGFRFFDPDMQIVLEARLSLENDLRRALGAGELCLHFQPQMDENGRVVGAEGLLRWQHPQQGLLLPGAFVALAEENGMILPMGREVLRMACAQLQHWASQPLMQPLTLAINVSSLQFDQADFVSQVADMLRVSQIEPGRLKLELTESTLLKDVESCIDKMKQLQQLGVQIALDDFGTGYSSLALLQRLPIWQLKIDRSFVHSIGADGAVIVQTILAMARSLRLAVIAEGVETNLQHDFLRQHGCEQFQGFLFGHALPAAQFERCVAQNNTFDPGSFRQCAAAG